MCDAKAAVSLTAPAAVVASVWAVGLPIWPAVTCSILGLCAVGCVALVLTLRYGRSMRPSRVGTTAASSKQTAVSVGGSRAITAPPRAIGAPVTGTVLTPAEYAERKAS